MRRDRFHGRFDTEGQLCQHPGCDEAGEFRAPSGSGNSFDGPGRWRWFCLDHVREFNAGYDWFEGMSAEEMLSAQSPSAGWQTETPAFKPTAGVDGMPRWADFADPLDAIGARAGGIKNRARREAQMAMDGRFSKEEAQAMEVMGLGIDTDRQRLRRRYSDLVRRYHPDRNGGNRKYEARLTKVVEAYQLLRKSNVFS
ncbi:J domain-containing protein [Qipengyuania atrilutea]|uniref:J domain-containing protein n=1 Tax=Qipengyuania atrilutea TaxID=2744473 RepID=A0A850H6Z1_9SPHN|nr:J domain-containing protein [Actirhodobacter atriluteus]NVD45618.1 J domain-containing protein [Actirhodobacter atriluteus]